MEHIANHSKSVAHFRCYAIPPLTGVYALGKTDLAIKVPKDKSVTTAASRPSRHGYKTIEAPPGDTVKIDVLGPNQEIIAVGGPAKGARLRDLGGNLKRLKALADWHNTEAFAYFEIGTAEEVLAVARKWLGGNVRTF